VASLPINKGDFIIAYVAAFERWREMGFPWAEYKGDRDAGKVKECIRVGLDEVRDMRGVKRLPPGAGQLREQVKAAFAERKDRMKRHRDYARHDTGYKWPWERRAHSDRWEFILRYHYERAILSRIVDITRATPWAKSVESVGLDLRDDGYHDTVAASIGGRGHRFSLVVEPGPAYTAIQDRIAVVEGQIVLGATRCDAFALPLGMAAVYDVTYAPAQEVSVQSYSSAEIRVEPGVVIVPEDGAPHFAHSRANAVYGALCAAANTSHYRKSRRGSK
jgi:hypothetical protein